MAGKKKYFGFGSFNFTVIKEPPFTLTGKLYLDELNSALESISNISNIQITTFGRFEEFDLEVKEAFEPYDRGRLFFPYPGMDLQVDLDIYIPFRVQEDVHYANDDSLNTHTENFHLSIRFSPFFLPVAIVESISPSDGCRPSEAVMIVREFLQREFERGISDIISFEYLGPSPFHADFYLHEKADEGITLVYDDFWVGVEKRRSYDLVNIYFREDIYDDLRHAALAFILEIEEEFSFFYSIVQLRNRKMFAWRDFEDKFDLLISKYGKKTINSFIYKLIGVSTDLEQLFFELAEIEKTNIFMDQFIDDYLQKMKNTGSDLRLEPYIVERINSMTDYPIKQSSDLLNMIDSRQSRAFERLITLIAAILGGAIGSIITLLLTNY